MGSLIATALLALVLVGLAWRPGLALVGLGLVVVALGLLPHLPAPPLPQLDAFKTVLGVGSNPPVIAGLFIVALGRLIMLVQSIARRPRAAAAAPDDGSIRSRREPATRYQDRL